MWPFTKRQQPATGRTATADRIKRFRSAVRSAVGNVFKAAGVDRFTAKWGIIPLGADEIVRRHWQTLVARSREQANSNDYVKSYVRMCHKNIVGHAGIVLNAQAKDPDGTLDQAANEAHERAWNEWGRRENCDVTGRNSWRAMQVAAVKMASVTGEFMFLIVTGKDAGPWGFALQAIDPIRCPVDYDDNTLSGGAFIRHGIEFNAYGRPVAYYFTTTKEREASLYSSHGNRYERVPAENVVHGFIEDIVGQKRGLPWTATALWRLKMIEGYEDAALVNARIGASKCGFFKWKDGYGPEKDEDEDLTREVEPGIFDELPAGVEFESYEPTYPLGEMTIFNKAMLRGAAAGLGASYNNLANDLEGVNFSSIRQGTLDEREHWMECQEWLTESLHEPVHDKWLRYSLLARKITLPGGAPLKPERVDKYSHPDWQPRRWPWVDPRADMEAAVTAKNNLMASPSKGIREQGDNPANVWRQVAADIKAMREAGIPEEYIQASLLGQKSAPPPPKKQGAPNAADPEAQPE